MIDRNQITFGIIYLGSIKYRLDEREYRLQYAGVVVWNSNTREQKYSSSYSRARSEAKLDASSNVKTIEDSVNDSKASSKVL